MPALIDEDSNSERSLVQTSAALDVEQAHSIVHDCSTVFLVLYCFCGEERRGDVKEWLLHWLPSDISLQMTEIDLARDGTSNLNDPGLQERVLQLIETHHFVLSTPPCNTFTRLVWSNRNGPGPLRSHQWQRGYPWLEGWQRNKIQEHNSLVDFTFLVFKKVHEQSLKRFCIGFGEHPEDLGRVLPWDPTSWPASIWHWPQMEDLMALGWQSGALHQSPYGADTLKPTRLIYNLHTFDDMVHLGHPEFDDNDKYVGPLPPGKNPSDYTMVRKQGETGPFRSAKASAYPSAMCSDIAQKAVTAFLCYEGPGFQTEAAKLASDIPSGGEVKDTNSMLNKIYVEVLPQSPSPLASLPLPSPLTSLRPGIPADVAEIIPIYGTAEPNFNGCLQDESDNNISDPDIIKAGWWGKGKPLKTNIGKDTGRYMRDGAGYCSPGRWPPSMRIKPPAARPFTDILEAALPAEADYKLIVLKTLLGKVEETPVKELAKNVKKSFMEALSSAGFHRPSPHPPEQAIDYGLMHILAQALGDPDAKIALECLTGVRVGHDIDLCPNPAIWPTKRKWKLDKDTNKGQPSYVNANYPSAADSPELMMQEIQQQIDLGFMIRTTFGEAKKVYGSRLRVASMALIKEKESNRTVHDATNRVQLNHGIHIPDTEQFPGPMDVSASLQYDFTTLPQPPSKYLGLKSDVSKAHRRVPLDPRDYGLVACAIRPMPTSAAEGDLDSWEIFLNTVGTYGVGSAGWYWGRVGSLWLRILHYLIDLYWAFRFADDYLFLQPSTTPRPLRIFFLIILVAETLGIPLKWKKTSGGSILDWVGFHFDFEVMNHGLAPSRRDWIQTWVNEVIVSNRGALVIRELEGFVGRLGFAAQVLVHVKPFMAYLYAWVAVANRSHVSVMPAAVRLVLIFIARLVCSKGMVPMRRHRVHIGELFRADAKAEKGLVVIGGFEVIDGGITPASRWFSLALTPESAPWAFWRGMPYRSIGALELFASLISLLSFKDRIPKCSGALITLQGVTDNQGNHFLMEKGLTTTFPLSLIHMELAALLDSLDLRLDLQWKRREENIEADALTNSDFTSFNPNTRVAIDLDRIEFLVLPWLQEQTASLFKLVQASKQLPRSLPSKRRKKGGSLRVTDPW